MKCLLSVASAPDYYTYFISSLTFSLIVCLFSFSTVSSATVSDVNEATCCQIWIISMRHVLASGDGDMVGTSRQWCLVHNNRSSNAASPSLQSPTGYSTVSKCNFILFTSHLILHIYVRCDYVMSVFLELHDLTMKWLLFLMIQRIQRNLIIPLIWNFLVTKW